MPKKYTDDIEALQVINDRITITERFWRPYHDDFNEIYAAYRFYTEVTNEVARGEKSNIFVPYAFAQIETKLPRIVQAVLGYNPFFQVLGVGREDAKNAQGVQNLVHHQLENEIDTFIHLLTWWKECLMYGNSFMMIPWKKVEKKLKRNVPNYMGQDIVGYDVKRQKVTKYDGPDLQPIDIFDCFPAPYGTRIETMPYFIVRSEPNAWYLKEMAEKKIFRPDAVRRTLDKMSGSGTIDRTRTDRLAYAGLTTFVGDDRKAPRYEMYTMWEDDWVITVIDNEVLRNEPTPFSEEEKPLVMAVDTPIPHELFGFGDIRPILKSNYYANDMFNLNADNFFSIINPGMLVSRDSGLDIAKFEAKPNGTHMVDGPTGAALSPIVRGSYQMDTMNQMGLLERIMSITSGSGDVMRGIQASKGSQTASEVATLVEQANYRFDLNIRILKEYSLKRMLNMILWRNQDFMPWEKTVRILGKDGAPQYPLISYDQILGNYDFKLKISPVQGSKTAWGQNLIMFLEVVNKDQGQHPELTALIGEALGIDGATEYVKNPALEAGMIISQAVREGLVKNAQQAFVVLLAVLNKLAPPGSPNAQAIGQIAPPTKGTPGSKMPPKDMEGVVRQEASRNAQPKGGSQ